METLNVDALSVEQRSITLGGMEHLEKQVNFEEYIKLVSDAKAKLKELEEKGVKEEDLDDEETAKNFIELVQMSFPTITDDMIKALNVKQVKALMDFCISKDADPDEEKKT